MGGETVCEITKKISSYKELFDSSFKTIVDELVAEYEENPEVAPAAIWLRKALNYNTFDGKKSRGMMVIGTVDFFCHGKPTEEEIQRAIILGWCVEILQAVFLVADDVMDRSDVRRGKKCWYKKCGLLAINDTYLMEHSIFKLIDSHFSSQPYIFQLYKTFHNIIYLTAMGQELDMLASEPPESDFMIESYTMEKYKSIVKYKTAYYSFYLPVSLGMHIVQIQDKEMFKEAEAVLLKLGEFFQVQDDYLDCYGDPVVMGKIGRDIEDRKCSWLVVQALERVNKEDRDILVNHYGKDDEKSVSLVKELYDKLELKSVYLKYEETSYKQLCDCINSHSEHFPKQFFIFLVNKLYKRQK